MLSLHPDHFPVLYVYTGYGHSPFVQLWKCCRQSGIGSSRFKLDVHNPAAGSRGQSGSVQGLSLAMFNRIWPCIYPASYSAPITRILAPTGFAGTHLIVLIRGSPPSPKPGSTTFFTARPEKNTGPMHGNRSTLDCGQNNKVPCQGQQ